MEWNDFLAYPEVANKGETSGKYLFLKTLHEIVAGLNGYRGWILLQAQISYKNVLGNNQGLFSQWNTAVSLWEQATLENIPNDVQIWASRWNPIVEKWIAELMLLRQRHETDVLDDADWVSLINSLATIVDEISLQRDESQTLTIPNAEQDKDVVVGLINCVARVNKIRNYIRDKEYIKLWEFPY